jgi:hypothetical protein
MRVGSPTPPLVRVNSLARARAQQIPESFPTFSKSYGYHRAPRSRLSSMMIISRHCRRLVSAGLRRCYKRGERDWGAAMGDQKKGTKDARKIAGLARGQLPVQQHIGTQLTTHLSQPPSPQTINTFPSCSCPCPKTK